MTTINDFKSIFHGHLFKRSFHSKTVTWLLIFTLSLSQTAMADEHDREECRRRYKALTTQGIENIANDVKMWMFGRYLRFRTHKVLTKMSGDVVDVMEKACVKGCSDEEAKNAVIILLEAKYNEWIVSSPGVKGVLIYLGSALLAQASSYFLQFSARFVGYPELSDGLKDLNQMLFFPIVLGAGIAITKRLENFTTRASLNNAHIKRNIYEKDFERTAWLRRAMISPIGEEGRYEYENALSRLENRFNTASLYAQTGDMDAAALAVAGATRILLTMKSDVNPYFIELKAVAYELFAYKYVPPDDVDEFIVKVLAHLKERTVDKVKAKKVLESWLREPYYPPADPIPDRVVEFPHDRKTNAHWGGE